MIQRLPADADLNGAIVSGVVRRSVNLDFKRAEEVPLEGLRDDVVLAIAAEDRRVLVSHDVSGMPHHFREYIRYGNSPGIISVPQDLSIGKACGEDDLANRVCLVPSLVMFGF